MAPFLAARFTLGTAPCFPDGGFHPLCRLSFRRGQSPGRFALFWTDQKQQYGKARYKIFPFLLAWGRVASLHLSNISSDASGCERVCEARMGKEMKTRFLFPWGLHNNKKTGKKKEPPVNRISGRWISRPWGKRSRVRIPEMEATLTQQVVVGGP